MRMRPARLSIVVCASLLAACATLAGLEEPSEVSVEPDGAPEAAAPDDVSAPDATDDASDAPVDRTPVADACALKPDNAPCAVSSECCSQRCSEALRCAATCQASPLGDCQYSAQNCCVGLWCGGGSGDKCIACVKPGQPAARNGNLVFERSCCARRGVDGNYNCR
jgi:hypothetical protein